MGPEMLYSLGVVNFTFTREQLKDYPEHGRPPWKPQPYRPLRTKNPARNTGTTQRDVLCVGAGRRRNSCGELSTIRGALVWKTHPIHFIWKLNHWTPNPMSQSRVAGVGFRPTLCSSEDIEKLLGLQDFRNAPK